jgi:putative toxin-antitoxin system antitoxin component (TIGR02293 family)
MATAGFKEPILERKPGRARREPPPGRVPLTNFRTVFASTADVRVKMIKSGVAAIEVGEIARKMKEPKERLYKLLRLSRATVDRKVRANERLSTDDSERVLGMSLLIGQVEAMVAESGDPSGFDAARWLARWLDQPLPALNDEHPADYMDTIEGQKLVSNLLAVMQSGAYA